MTKFVPVTPGGTLYTSLYADTEEKAWDNLMLHYDGIGKDFLKARGYTIIEEKTGIHLMKQERSMQITELDAKTRMCPMTFKSCLGSQCMAWRWVGKEDPEKQSRGFCGLTPQFPSR